MLYLKQIKLYFAFALLFLFCILLNSEIINYSTEDFTLFTFNKYEWNNSIIELSDNSLLIAWAEIINGNQEIKIQKSDFFPERLAGKQITNSKENDWNPKIYDLGNAILIIWQTQRTNFYHNFDFKMDEVNKKDFKKARSGFENCGKNLNICLLDYNLNEIWTKTYQHENWIYLPELIRNEQEKIVIAFTTINLSAQNMNYLETISYDRKGSLLSVKRFPEKHSLFDNIVCKINEEFRWSATYTFDKRKIVLSNSEKILCHYNLNYRPVGQKEYRKRNKRRHFYTLYDPLENTEEYIDEINGYSSRVNVGKDKKLHIIYETKDSINDFSYDTDSGFKETKQIPKIKSKNQNVISSCFTDNNDCILITKDKDGYLISKLSPDFNTKYSTKIIKSDSIYIRNLHTSVTEDDKINLYFVSYKGKGNIYRKRNLRLLRFDINSLEMVDSTDFYTGKFENEIRLNNSSIEDDIYILHHNNHTIILDNHINKKMQLVATRFDSNPSKFSNDILIESFVSLSAYEKKIKPNNFFCRNDTLYAISNVFSKKEKTFFLNALSKQGYQKYPNFKKDFFTGNRKSSIQYCKDIDQLAAIKNDSIITFSIDGTIKNSYHFESEANNFQKNYFNLDIDGKYIISRYRTESNKVNIDIYKLYKNRIKLLKQVNGNQFSFAKKYNNLFFINNSFNSKIYDFESPIVAWNSGIILNDNFKDCLHRIAIKQKDGIAFFGFQKNKNNRFAFDIHNEFINYNGNSISTKSTKDTLSISRELGQSISSKVRNHKQLLLFHISNGILIKTYNLDYMEIKEFLFENKNINTYQVFDIYNKNYLTWLEESSDKKFYSIKIAEIVAGEIINFETLHSSQLRIHDFTITKNKKGIWLSWFESCYKKNCAKLHFINMYEPAELVKSKYIEIAE